MATIRKHNGKYGITYRAEICVNRVRKYATFDSQSAAHAWAEEVEAALRSGQGLPGEVAPGDMPMQDAVDRYLVAVGSRKKLSTRLHDAEIAARLLKNLGHKTLRQLTREDLATYRDMRLQSVGPSSVIQDLSFVRCLYRLARLEWGLADLPDPTTDLRRPSPPHHRLTLLTPAEITRLLDWCCVSKQEMLYSYVLLLLHTAMRPSEAAGLRWSQVLWHDGMLDLTVTKTEPRRVPLTQTALAQLGLLRAEAGQSERVFLPDARQSDLPASRYFRRAFETACRAAGVRCTLYGLRHSAASYLIMHGVDIRTVAEIMGHKNISQTMRYTHFLDGHKLTAIQALDKIGG